MLDATLLKGMGRTLFCWYVFSIAHITIKSDVGLENQLLDLRVTLGVLNVMPPFIAGLFLQQLYCVMLEPCEQSREVRIVACLMQVSGLFR